MSALLESVLSPEQREQAAQADAVRLAEVCVMSPDQAASILRTLSDVLERQTLDFSVVLADLQQAIESCEDVGAEPEITAMEYLACKAEAEWERDRDERAVEALS